ncbi:MAG: DUF2232 domain-containing protein [Granulosicoccus sp.]
MLGIARLADRGPGIAAGIAATLLMAALWLPIAFSAGSAVAMLFVIVSAAVVAFVLLRRGEQAALKTIGFCLGLLLLVSLVLYRSAIQVPLVAMVFWLPAIIAAGILGRSTNLGLAVLSILASGVVAVLGISVFSDGDSAFWREPLARSLEMSVASSDTDLTAQQMETLVESISNMMTGALGVSVMSVAMCALFLARYWQAALVNPGGFRKEFHALSLGRHAALACMVVIAVALLQKGPLLSALAMVSVFAFFIQGLAVVHALVSERGLGRGWLYGLYVLLLLPHTVLLLAALGLADSVYRLRKT